MDYLCITNFYFFSFFLNFNFLLLFNYSCVPFLRIPPHPLRKPAHPNAPKCSYGYMALYTSLPLVIHIILCIQGGAKLSLQLFIWKNTIKFINNNTRTNSVFHVFTSVNLLLPHSVLYYITQLLIELFESVILTFYTLPLRNKTELFVIKWFDLDYYKTIKYKPAKTILIRNE